MARYKILIPDTIAAAGAGDPAMRLALPEGCSVAGRLGPGSAGTHWYLLDDPGAPGSLEGREVSPRMARDGAGKPVIAERRLIRAHQAPGDEDEAFPCCGLPFDELPGFDRVTPDPALVTCGGDG